MFDNDESTYWSNNPEVNEEKIVENTKFGAGVQITMGVSIICTKSSQTKILKKS